MMLEIGSETGLEQLRRTLEITCPESPNVIEKRRNYRKGGFLDYNQRLLIEL
jgi:hypothetical protein